MTKKKGHSKGGGPGGDREMEDDDASTDEEPPSGPTDNINCQEVALQRSNDKSHPTSPRCPHVGKAVNVSAIKKALKAAWIPIGRCGVCTREKRTPNQAPAAPGKKGQAKGTSKAVGPNMKGKTANPNVPSQDVVDPSIPSSIWLCLRCGVQSCRPNVKSMNETKVGHALVHFKVPRSDLHCICLNVTPPLPSSKSEEVGPSRWDIFCFECNSNLYLDSYKKLHEAVEFVRRLSETKSITTTSGGTKPLSKNTSAVVKKGESATNNMNVVSGQNADGAISKSRGLVNLGNTCFFNSVMQGLTQSHPLTHLILTRNYCQKGTSFEIPSVQLDVLDHSRGHSPNESVKTASKNVLDAMTLTLEEAGNMTLSFASFLSDMANITAKGVVNPSQLFGQISARSPQFRGFQQQDAHELLRHLIEGLRTEEVKRQRKAILKYFGLTEKTDPKTVVGETRRKLQALKQHSNYTIIDKIFGGHLVSTVVCEVCHNSSQNYEPFLDLSLPLIEERDHPPTSKQKQNFKRGKVILTEESRKNCDANPVENSFGAALNCTEIDEKKSKHQLKKEKLKNRKEKRKNKKINKKEDKGTIDETEPAPTVDDEKVKGLRLGQDKENIKDSSTNIDHKEENIQDSSVNIKVSKEVKVIVESASSKEERESNTTQDSTTQRLQLRTTSRTPLNTMQNSNRSRSVSPSISERMRALSKEPSPANGRNSRNDSGGASSSPSRKANISILKTNTMTKNLEKFQSSASSKLNKNEGKVSRGGSEEDDEGDAYLDDDEEWEWEYEETQKVQKESENSDVAVDGSESETDTNTADKEKESEKPMLVSLNPLPPERLLPSDHEKSSVEHGDAEDQCNGDSEATTGASSNADVEDNLDIDVGVNSVNASTASNNASIMNRLYSVESSTAEWASTTTSLLEKPFQPDPDHLDPHMEELCKNIRKLSVTTSTFKDSSILVENATSQQNIKDSVEGADEENSATNSSSYQTATAVANINSQTEGGTSQPNTKMNGNNNKIEDRTLEEELHMMQLQNEWVTRSLTSVAPRYRSQQGECSVYSCLTQFTAPELLTGNNKWACGRCTKLKKEEKLARRESSNNLPFNDYTSDTSTENPLQADDVNKEKSRTTEKSETVYSNASKQLLVFCPPAVLTIHLKRFQQTMTGLRKVSKHVEFPISLDLAPFCSSTSMSMSNVPPGVKEMKYYLYGVVEHSGRLHGGHYTAYVNARCNQTSKYLSEISSKDNKSFQTRFYSTPNAKTDHIEALLNIIEMKSKLFNEMQTNKSPSAEAENLSDIKSAAAAAAFGDKKDECKKEDIVIDSTTNSDNTDFVPNGKWYHISDSIVTEVAQEKVLKCQAYILFYERIK